MILIKNTVLLKETIIKEGFSFAEMARILDISRSALNKIFNREKISPKHAQKISEILKIEYDDFFILKSVQKNTNDFIA